MNEFIIELITVIGFFVTILGFIIGIPPVLEKGEKEKILRNNKKEIEKNFHDKQYSIALTGCRDLLSNIEYFNNHDRGEIYLVTGHCIIDDPNNSKNYDKIFEGITFLEKAQNSLDLNNYFFKRVIFRIITNFNELFFIKQFFNFLKIDRYRISWKLTKYSSSFKYAFNYARAENDLGIAYCRLAEIKNGIENIQRAIQFYRNALSIYEFERFPQDHVLTSENLITTFKNLVSLTKSNYFQYLANKTSYEIFLKTNKYPALFYIKEDTPEYAKTILMAGDSLRLEYENNRTMYEGGKFISASIDCYLKALNYYKVENHAIEYAYIQNNLGIAYSDLFTINGLEINFNKSEECFLNALIIKTKEKYPIAFAQTSFNLGALYNEKSFIMNGENKIPYLLKAISEFEKSLEIRKISDYPKEYAESHLHLGISFYLLSQLQNSDDNIKSAIKSLNEAEKIITQDSYPTLYRILMNTSDRLNCK